MYAARLRRPGQVDIKAVKNAVSVAGLPAGDGEDVFQAFRTLYPQAVRSGSVLETSFANLTRSCTRQLFWPMRGLSTRGLPRLISTGRESRRESRGHRRGRRRADGRCQQPRRAD